MERKSILHSFLLLLAFCFYGSVVAVAQNTEFKEDFSECDGTGGNDGQWSGSIASSTVVGKLAGWTLDNCYGGDACLKLGAGSKLGSATTPALGITGDATLTFRAGAWNASREKTTITVSITGGGTPESTPIDLTKGAFSEYTIEITGLTAESKITFAANQASNNRFFLDDVRVTPAGGGQPAKPAAGLSFGEVTDFTIEIGDAFTAPALSKATDAAVTYESSQADVASVDAQSGEVTIHAIGTTTITATTPETDDYAAGTASYTLTVKEKTVYVTYRKAAGIESGKTYLLVVNADGAFKAAQALEANKPHGYLPAADVTETENGIALPENNACEFIAEASGEGYTLTDAYGRQLYQTGTYNSFNVAETPEEGHIWTIEANDDGTFKMMNVSVSKYIQYSSRYDSFGSYADEQGIQPVLYERMEEEASTGSFTIGEAGYATFFTDKAFVMPEGVEGAVVLGNEGDKLNIEYAYTAGSVVPANTGLLLKAAEGDYTYEISQELGTAYDGNCLHGFTTTTTPENNADYLYYKLAYDDYSAKTGLGFYWGAEGGAAFSVPAGKAYLALPAETAQGAQAFRFDNATTGISSAVSGQAAGAQHVYTLDGRRVSSQHLPAGLYIVNGKKVIIK